MTEPSFILIPGAGGMAWYWHRVAPLLEQAGREAVAVDLPADDSSKGLDDYADIMIRAIGSRSNVTLVAQSLACVCTSSVSRPPYNADDSDRFQRSSSPGKATMWQRTAKDRLVRTLKAINQQCRFMRCWSLADQPRRLSRMLEGHFAYFGITGNYRRLAAVVYQTRRLWRKWLSRRSWKSYVTWAQFLRLVETYPLPAPRIVHRYA